MKILNSDRVGLFISCGLLIICLVVLDFYKRKSELSESKITYIKNEYDAVANNMFLLAMHHDGIIDSNNRIINEDNHIVKINSLSKNTFLILRIKETNCQECIIAEADRIKTFAKKIGTSKILIFGDFRSLNILTLLKKSLHLPYKSFLIKEIKWSYGNVDSVNIPYMFVLSGQTVSCLYFPEKNLPDKTSNFYYNLVNENIKF
jgi:hypothetical protein